MEKSDLVLLAALAIFLFLAVGLRWQIRRTDVSRIKGLLARDESELMSCKSLFFGPNWLSGWLMGTREYTIRYRDAQSSIRQSIVLTSIIFGTSFSRTKVVEQSKSEDDNDAKLRELIDYHKNN